MSVDPHWFSTLFGWYVFAGWFVAGLATIALITVGLKDNGYLSIVNANHLHDLGKYIFVFSIFWMYLWFSQYMLIYYANIPEETLHYYERLNNSTYAAMFYLKHNFNALGRRNMAQKIVAGGLVYAFLMAVVIYFLPEDFADIIISAVNLAAVMLIMQNKGMKKEELLAAGHEIQGVGRTLAVGLAGFMLQIAVLLGVVVSIDLILGTPG